MKKIKFLLPLIPLLALVGCDMDNGDDVRSLLQWVLIGAGAIIFGIAYIVKAIAPKKKIDPPASTPHTPPPLPTMPATDNPDTPVHEPPKENSPQQ